MRNLQRKIAESSWFPSGVDDQVQNLRTEAVGAAIGISARIKHCRTNTAPYTFKLRGLPDGRIIPIGNSILPESEDCLFIDVVVPMSVDYRQHRQLAPMLVNIPGCGFFVGDKATLYSPQGLLAARRKSTMFDSMN